MILFITWENTHVLQYVLSFKIYLSHCSMQFHSHEVALQRITCRNMHRCVSCTRFICTSRDPGESAEPWRATNTGIHTYTIWSRYQTKDNTRDKIIDSDLTGTGTGKIGMIGCSSVNRDSWWVYQQPITLPVVHKQSWCAALVWLHQQQTQCLAPFFVLCFSKETGKGPLYLSFPIGVKGCQTRKNIMP